MGIQTIMGNYARNFSEGSTWTIVGDGDEGPEYEFGAKVWLIGKIEITIARHPFHQLEVANTRAPNAGAIGFEGRKLPNWPRLYKFDLCSTKLNAKIGASTPDIPLNFSASITQEVDDAVTGTDIFRHQSAGAPTPSGIAGDPTGLLGLGVAMSAGGGSNLTVVSAGVDTTIFLFRSNIQEVGEKLARGQIGAAARHVLGSLLFGNHLKFFYSGALASTALNLAASLDFYTAGVEGGASVNAVWVSALHLYILKPGESEYRYVYSRHSTIQGASAPYKNPKLWKGPKWDQSWL